MKIREECVDAFLNQKIAIRANGDDALFDLLQDKVEQKYPKYGRSDATMYAWYAYNGIGNSAVILWDRYSEWFAIGTIVSPMLDGYEIISIEDLSEEEEEEETNTSAFMLLLEN